MAYTAENWDHGLLGWQPSQLSGAAEILEVSFRRACVTAGGL